MTDETPCSHPARGRQWVMEQTTWADQPQRLKSITCGECGKDITTKIVALKLASARNHSYETNMGEYSQDSIDRARRGVDEALALTEEIGKRPEELVRWDDERGYWCMLEEYNG